MHFRQVPILVARYVGRPEAELKQAVASAVRVWENSDVAEASAVLGARLLARVISGSTIMVCFRALGGVCLQLQQVHAAICFVGLGACFLDVLCSFLVLDCGDLASISFHAFL
jgi:hypothetical protein